MDLAFKTLINSNDPALSTIEQIYLDSIPASGRKPTPWLRELPPRPDYQFLLATDSQTPIGFSILFHPPLEHFALLEYFAIAATYRNQGIGSALFQHTLRQTQPRTLIIELESALPDCPDQSRRIAFYRRQGCHRIANLAYHLPLNTSPPQMNLYLANPPATFSRDTLSHWLSLIYQQVYQQPTNDPRLHQMLQNLPTIPNLD